MTKRLSTRWRRVIVACTVVALVLGLRWYLYPANRLRRVLDRIDMPGEVRHDGDDMLDNGWLCIDSCSSAHRYWVTDLPPDEAAPLVEKALREAGFEGSLEPCVDYGSPTDCLMNGPTERDEGHASFEMSFEGGPAYGRANVGVREDGTYGVEVVVVAG